MYPSSMMLCLGVLGLITCSGGTTYAKPLQGTGGQLLTRSTDGPETNSHSLLSLANVSSLSPNVSGQSNFDIHCERYKYGFVDDEILRDCETALPYMTGSDVITFVDDRDVKGNVLGLPYRQYGRQANCYYETVLMEGKATAHATMNQARNAAIHLLAQCGKQFQGGVASNIGDGNLALILGKYPLKPQCRGAMPADSLKYCGFIAFRMPAEDKIQLFGPASDPQTEIDLPCQMRSISCSLMIYSTSKTPVRSSNYAIWQAVAALMSVCVMQLQGGSVTGLGEDGSIFITLKHVASAPGIEVPETASLTIIR